MKTMLTISLSLLMSTAFIFSSQAQNADQNKTSLAPLSGGTSSPVAPYIGVWQGFVRTASGNHRVALDVASRPGDSTLIADVITSAQSPFSVLVDSFETQDHHVRLTMRTAGTSFEGTSSKNMTEIRGTWKQDGKTYPLTLRRLDLDAKSVMNDKHSVTAQASAANSGENTPEPVKVHHTPVFTIGMEPWFSWYDWTPSIGGQQRHFGLNYW